MVKVTSPLTSRKQGFFFYLTKLKSDILLDVYKKKKFNNLIKHSNFLQKCIFNWRLLYEKGVNLVNRRNPWRNFRGNRSPWSSYFFYYASTSLHTKYHQL